MHFQIGKNISNDTATVAPEAFGRLQQHLHWRKLKFIHFVQKRTYPLLTRIRHRLRRR